MSNFLAVATVTEVLRSILDEVASAAVTDVQVDVSTGRPDAFEEDDGHAHLSVFLYQVLPNAALRNDDLPTRREDGALVRRPRAALDLHFLLTFVGDAARQVPERLLGAAVTELHSRSVLDRQRIRDVIQAQQATKPFLAQSDLADAVELVKLSPLPLSLEELSKLWSVFFQVPYSLSVAYEATVVLLEPQGLAPQQALPVRGPAPPDGRDGRRIYVDPFRRPAIEAVAAAAGPDEPIVAGATLAIRGQRLRGEVTEVRIGGRAIVPPPAEPSDDEIEVPLTAPPVEEESLRAGVVGVQVVHRRLMGDPETPHLGVESNLVPFVLRPRIVNAAVGGVAVTEGDTRSADVTLEIDPPVGKRQRVVLLLNELQTASPPAPPPTRAARAYSFEAPSRDLPAEPESAAELTIPVRRVRPADYLVRVQIDGAESPLTLGTLPATPAIRQYVEPRVEIP
jgi:uncharacterized protein DUF4255